MKWVFEWADRNDGNMSLVWEEETSVNMNRKQWLDQLGIKPEDCVKLSLLGKSSFREVGKKDAGKMYEADALVTREDGVPLFMVVGDCFPVGIFDPVKNFLALAHLGRQGTTEKLVVKVVEKLKKMGSRPQNLRVKIGPGIRKESYKFSPEELAKRIDPKDMGWKPYLEDDGKGWVKIDLVGYLKKQLKDGAVEEENIEDCGIDTKSDINYFSHYRDRGGDKGRFGVVTMIRK